MQKVCIQFYDMPMGQILLGSFEGKLCLADWRFRTKRESIDKRLQQGLKAEYIEQGTLVLEQARKQLDEYVHGERKAFDIPLLMVGTSFQKQVWHGLMNMPYGVTCSYLELSKHIGKTKAVRAVASSVGANAISIFIPCHRIIGSGGSLTGYAGGLEAKRYLLSLEHV